MANTTENFLLRFGFEGRKALNGLEKLDKKLQSVEKRMARLSGMKAPDFAGGGRGTSGGFSNRAPQSNGRRTPRDLKQIRKDKTRRFQGSQGMLALAERDQEKANKLAGAFHRAQVKKDILGMGKVRKEVTDLNRQYRHLERRTNAMKRANRGLATSFKVLAAGMAISTLGIVEGTRLVLRAGKEMESLRASMLVASGDAKTAAEDFQFVRDQAFRLGKAITPATKGFQQLAVASKGVISEGEMKELYTSTLEISTALGLTQDETSGAIRAFTQMASKGKVTAEELKGQLGERVPGALNMMAEAMGKTTSQLFKMMENGDLLSSEALPRMAREMARVAREGGALEAQINNIVAAEGRLNLVFTEFLDKIAQDGVNDAYKELLKTLTEFFDVTGFQSDETRKALATIIESFINLADTILNNVLPALENFSRWFNETHRVLAKNFGKDTADMIMALGGLVVAFSGVILSLKALRLLLFGRMFIKGGKDIGTLSKAARGFGGALKGIPGIIAAIGSKLASLRKHSKLLTLLGGTTAAGIAGLSLYEGSDPQKLIRATRNSKADTVMGSVVQSMIKPLQNIDKISEFTKPVQVNVSMDGLENFFNTRVEQKLFESDTGGV